MEWLVVKRPRHRDAVAGPDCSHVLPGERVYELGTVIACQACGKAFKTKLVKGEYVVWKRAKRWDRPSGAPVYRHRRYRPMKTGAP